MQTPEHQPGSSDKALMRIIGASTALAFAGILGSVACVDQSPAQGLIFRWRWMALIWMAIGALAGWLLWRAVWAADAAPTPRARRRLKIYLLVLAAGGLAVFVFPIIFVPAGQFREVLMGLFAAVAVLSLVGWMIFRLGKLFGAGEEEPHEKPRR